MKSTPTLQFSIQRLFLLTLVSFVAVAALLGVAASANKANRAAKANEERANNSANPLGKAVADKQRQAPNVVGITASLTDNVTPNTNKVAPGATVNYTAVITSTGGVGEDALTAFYNDVLDTNTTYVASSVHASPIAFNDTYNWVGNTQLDTAARALPAVTANDIAVNATLPAPGTDTFTLTAIAGGATALGGVVTLASPSGAFTYTPPLGRPNLADGASVTDSFTYTITNSADPSLTGTGTVNIVLTGRVWYLQAGAAGDGRSNTPSSSPAAMSTAADKSTDIFYIFANAGSLNGPFSVDAGQQLLGQGVNLVVNAITLFTAAAPPTTTNTAGSCVALAGAPGNNTVSGFNIGNCTGGTAITGANVGTLNVSTMSINTNGGGLDLTGVGTPTVSVVLGGLTSTGGTKNVNLVGLNGTFTLASGALSGATNNAFDVNGGNAGITYSGTISNSGARQVSIINKTSGTVALSGAVSGTGTGIFMNANGTSVINFTGGVVLSTGTNDAFTATSSGTTTVTGAANTLTTTTGQALKVTSTTIAATGLTFATISSNGGANNGITLDTTGALGGLTVTGTGGTCTSATPTCTGGTIVNKTGGDGSFTQGIGIYLKDTINVSLTRMSIQGHQNHGIRGQTVAGFTLDNSVVGTSGINGTNAAADTDAAGFSGECSIRFFNLTGSATISNSTLDQGFNKTLAVVNDSGTLNRLTVTNCTVRNNQPASTAADSMLVNAFGNATLNFTVNGACIFNAVRGFHITTSANGTSTMDIVINGGNAFSNTINPLPAGGGTQFGSAGTDSFVTANIDGNSFRHGTGASAPGVNNVGRMMTIGAVSGTTKFDAKITNNTFGVTGIARSGAGDGADAIGIFASGNQGTTRVNGTTHSRFLVQNNVIKRYGETGILINARQGTSIIDATVFGNTINEPGTAALGAFAAIWVNAGALPADTSRVDIVIGAQATAANKNTMQDSDPSNATDVFLDRNSCGGCASTLNLYRNGSAAGGAGEALVRQILVDDNNATLDLLAGFTNGSTIGTPAGVPPVPPIPNPADDTGRNQRDEGLNGQSTNAVAQTKSTKPPVTATPVAQASSKVRIATEAAKATPKVTAAESARIYRSEAPLMLSHHAVRSNFKALSQDPNAPTSGETINVPFGASGANGTLPAGKIITIKYAATINAPPLARQVSTQGTVQGSNFATVQTDDPDAAGSPNPTITLVDTLMTWNGVTSTDWNTATNWTQPAGGTQYAPGVSNPAVNDVVIPNVGAQPNISATDIGIYSLSLANGRTLTITNPRTLTIGGSPGGDLTLDGIISGGFLNLGTGTHVINNAGGTGSLSATNVATVLSGSTVTLNNNLQAGALAVNAGGSMTILNRTLSLNGSGAALTIPGGATFTTTGSTVVFNGTAAQQAAGIAYNNLTINNSIGLNVTGVTLTGNATVNGALALTSSDLNTSTFTLTQPNTTASTGVSDVVGTITRTAAFGTTTITFGNPNNQITFGAAGTKPTSLTVVMAKTAPATYATAVLRNYTISQVGTNTSTATVRLHYLDSELNGNLPETNLGLRRLRTGDGHWVAAPPPPGVPNRDGAANWVEAPAAPGVSGTDLPTQWTFSTLVPTAANGVVTGRIVDDNGVPVEGAVVRLAGTQNRKFITDANGFYRFENVETTGFYIVTPSRANYTFNPSSRSFSQIGDSTEATFGATLATSTFANPLDTPEYFVRQNYIDFLGREPDESGFNFWSDQILSCGSDTDCISRKRENVSAAYFLSIEFQRTGGLVDGLYRSAYAARPNFSEFMPDTRTVGLGVVVGVEGWEAKLAANKTAFINAFVNRPTFVAVYGNLDDSQYVDTLISHTGVSFTASERDALLSGLGTGGMTRAEALRSIAENNRFANAKFNEAFVMMEYFGYLRRDADVGGFAFWLNKLNEFNGNFERAEMVKAFIVSGEYRDRFPR